jgi:predicted NAD-dependent protein-ADP-ribosyltransferase YbiA (DUF1768 family)
MGKQVYSDDGVPQNAKKVQFDESGKLVKESVMEGTRDFRPENIMPENVKPFDLSGLPPAKKTDFQEFKDEWRDRIKKDFAKLDPLKEKVTTEADRILKEMAEKRLAAMSPEERKKEEDRIANRPKPLTNEEKLKKEIEFIDHQIALKEKQKTGLRREAEIEWFDPQKHGDGSQEFMDESEIPEDGSIPFETEVVKNISKRKRELNREIALLKQQRLNIVGDSKEHGNLNRLIAEKEKELEAYDLQKMKNFARRVRNMAAVSTAGIPLGLPGLITAYFATGKEERDLIKELYNESEVELSDLKTRRGEIVNELSKPDEKELKQVQSMLGSVNGGTGQDLQAENEYGTNKVAYAERTFLADAYSKANKEKIAERKRDWHTRGMLDVDVMQQEGFIDSISDPDKMKTSQAIYEKLRKTTEYQKANYSSKKALIDRAVGNHLKESIEDPVQRNNAHMEMMPYMLYNYMFTEDGGITLNGIQLYTENHNEILEDRKIDILNTIKKILPDSDPLKQLNDPYDTKVEYNTPDDKRLHEKLRKELGLIDAALDYNKKILEMNPEASKIRQLGAGVGSVSAKDLLTIGINEMGVALQIKKLTDKIENGEQPTFTESKILESFALLNMANGTKEMSSEVFGVPVSVYRIGAGVTEMLPYVASFVLTGGFFTAGKAGTKKLITQPLKKLAGPKAAQSINTATTVQLSKAAQKIFKTSKTSLPLGAAAVKAVEFTGGSMLQAVANQQLYQKALAEAMTGDVALTFGADDEDMLVKITANTTSKKDARFEAGVETFGEIFFERMGTDLMKAVGSTRRAAKAAVGIDPAKRLIPEKYMLGKYKLIKGANYPGKGFDKFIKEQAGWDGILEEYLEELGTYIFTKALTGEGAGGPKEFIGQQIETLGTVALFGSMMNITRFTQNYQRYMLPDRVIYKTKTPGGNEVSISLPKDVNDQIHDIFEKGSTKYFGEQIASVIEKNKDKLDKEQVAFIMEMVGRHSMNEMLKDFLPKDYQQKEVPETETEVEKQMREQQDQSEFMSALSEVRKHISPEHRAAMEKYEQAGIVEEKNKEFSNSIDIEQYYDTRKPILEDSKETRSKIEKQNSLLDEYEKLREAAENEQDEEKKISINASAAGLAIKATRLDKEIFLSREKMLKKHPVRIAIKENVINGRGLLNKLKMDAKSNEWIPSMPISEQEFNDLNDAVKRLSVKNMGEVTSNKEIIPDILIVEKFVAMQKRREAAGIVEEQPEETQEEKVETVPEVEAKKVEIEQKRQEDLKENKTKYNSAIQEVNLNELEFTELEDGKIEELKEKDVENYTKRFEQGEKNTVILVGKNKNGKLYVIDGHRRVLAAKKAGLTTLKAVVRDRVTENDKGINLDEIKLIEINDKYDAELAALEETTIKETTEQPKLQFEEELPDTSLTEEEQAEVDKENQRIEHAYPELFEMELIEEENGILIEPRLKDLIQKRNELRLELDALQKDEHGRYTELDESDNFKIDQLTVLNKYIESKELTDSKSKFQSLTADKKWDVLHQELKEGKELIGSVSYHNDRMMHVMLDNGHTVRAFYRGKNEPKNEKTTLANRAMQSPVEKVSLKLIPKEEWNADNKFRNRLGIPHGDKIIVVNKDGRDIGNVEESNWDKLKELKKQKEEGKNELSDLWSELGDIAEDLFTKKAVSDRDGKRVSIEDFLDVLIKSAIKLAERFGIDMQIIFQTLKEKIAETNNTAQNKDQMTAFLEQNRDKITNAVNAYFDNIEKQVQEMSENPVEIVEGYQEQEGEAKTETPEQIYSKLGDKTESNNVTIKPVYQKKGVEYARSIGGVFSLRLTGSEKHFGNPFSSDKRLVEKDGLIETSSTKESVVRYIDWVLNSNDQRAQWIRSEIESGRHKSKPIVYYKELGEPSHATALDYLINQHDFKTETIPAEQAEQPIDQQAEPINIYFGNNENAELSNFAERPFEDENISDVGSAYTLTKGKPIKWKTVEGAFQASKLIYASEEYWTDNNHLSQKGIDLVNQLAQVSAAEARQIGRKIKGLNTKEWDNNSENVMYSLIYFSFEQNSKALKKLIETGNATLTHIQDKTKWKEAFPRILMKVRNDFQRDLGIDVTQQRDPSQSNLTEDRLAEKKGKNGIAMEEVDSQTLDGNQKVQVLLRSFSPLWDQVQKLSNTKKDAIVTEFFKMAKDDRYNKVRDQESYVGFLELFRNQSGTHNGIIDVLKTQSYDHMRSLFNFFKNVRKTKHIAAILRGESVSMPILNVGPNYQELTDTFDQKTASISLNIYGKDYQGIEGIMLRIQDNLQQAKKIQTNWNNLTEDQRVEQVKEQHEKDLQMLEDITGIDSDTWRFYFNKQNKETEAYYDKNPSAKVTFNTYEELLEKPVYRKSGDRYFPRVQSDLVFFLYTTLQQTGSLDAESRMRVFKNYFKRGNEQRNVLSNLLKLSRSITESDDLAVSLIDVKGDRKSSFIQASHLQHVAENIRKLSVESRLVDYYRFIDQDAEITLIAGVQDYDRSSDMTGTEPKRMSIDDIMFSLTQHFLVADDYQQHLGQFGDKDHIATITVQKQFPQTSDYQKMKEEFEDFDQAVNQLLYRNLLPNRAYFATQKDGKWQGPAKDYKGDTQKEKLENLARHFVYNYAFWIKEVNKVFHGSLDRYGKDKQESLIQMMKRASTTATSGYLLDQNTPGGVRKSGYTMIVLNDAAFKGLLSEHGIKLEREMMDGLTLFSNEEMKRQAVSMGDIFLKPDKFDRLTSIKAAHSTVNHDELGGWRGLMKTNNVNIDVMEKMIPEGHYNVYTKLKELMKRLGIDAVTFTSGNKQLEFDVPVLDMYHPGSNVPIDFSKVPANAVFSRSYDDFYVQQDLRHDTNPIERAMASQAITTFYSLSTGNTIAEMFNQIRHEQYHTFLDKYKAETDNIIRLKILRDNLKKEVNDDIIALLDTGAGMNEPSLKAIMRTMTSSAVGKALLDIPTNRVTTQEIPDVMGILEGRRESKTSKGNSLLPDIASSQKGVRAHYHRFKGKPKEAIEYVKNERRKNPLAYEDLYDDQNRLKEWEIIDRNGIIPGGYVISVRIPTHGLPSITVGRLAISIKEGNFTMLDMESQRISGSDYDGDARFNSSLFTDNDGNIILDNSKYGIANRVFLSIARDYERSDLTERIQYPINTKAYDEIVERLRKNLQNYSEGDFRAYMQAWQNSQVGNDLKGKLTDINTIFGIASKHRLKLRNVTIPWNGKVMTSVNSDIFGSILRHIGDFQNMAFDNIKDPKLEDMGLNEVTVYMYMMPIMADPDLNSTLDKFKGNSDAHYKAIYDAINAQSDYFTSDLVREFVRQARQKNGGIYDSELGKVFENLKKSAEKEGGKWTEEDVKKLKDYYYTTREIYDIRSLYKLTQEMPLSISDLISARNLLAKFKRNSNTENGSYKLFDTGNFYNKEGNLKREFAYAEASINIAEALVFYDAVELNKVGKEVLYNIKRLLTNAHIKKYNIRNADLVNVEFTKPELERVSYHLNNILAVKAYNKDRTFEQVRDQLEVALNRAKAENPTNKFLNKVHVYQMKYGKSIEIERDNRYAPIGEIELAAIHNDFNKLDPKLKELLVTYAFHRFGTSASEKNGGYYKLISYDHKAAVEQKIVREMNRMENDQYSPEEIAMIVKHTLRASNLPRFKFFWNKEQTEPLRNYDINYQLPIEQVGYFIDGNAFDPDGSINNMLREDGIGEMLASKDPALTDFIIGHLKKNYPGVQIFENRDAFYDFARKHGANMEVVNPAAIGHAFRNAVFIDPAKAVQSTAIHEFVHIYWDALPKDSKAKQKLTDLYKSHRKYKDWRPDQIEERIIADISKVSSRSARIGFKGNVLERFLELLRDFWREVKRLVGVSGRKDLVRDLSKEIWNNKENIDVTSIEAGIAIKNMIQTIDNNTADSEHHDYEREGKHYQAVTKVYTAREKESFNIEDAAKRLLAGQAAAHLAESKENLQIEEYEAELRNIINSWDIRTEKGTVIHSVAEDIFGGKEINMSEIEKDFINNSIYEQLSNSLKLLKHEAEKKYPGITWSPEEKIFNDTYDIAGIIDLKGTLPNGKVVIFDFKTTDHPYKLQDGSLHKKYTQEYGLLLPPFKAGERSTKQKRQETQLGIYAAMIEEAGEKIEDIYVVPIYTQIINGKIMQSYVAREIGFDIEEGTMREAALWENIVQVPWNAARRKQVKALMKQSFESRKDISKEMEEYREVLRKNGIYEPIIDDAIKAERFFRSIKPDLNAIKYSDLEFHFSSGLSMISAALIEKGFATEQMVGKNAFPMEQLFYAAHRSDITLESFKDLDTFFPEQEVEIGHKRVISDKWQGNYFYKHKIDGEEVFFKEAGHETIKEGDEIIEVYYSTVGTKEREIVYRYKVTAVNPAGKYFLVENVNTGQVKRVDSAAGKEGTLLVVDKASIKSEKSYIQNKKIHPKYVTEKQTETQRHLKRIDKDLPENERKSYLSGVRQIELFFEAYNTADKLREFLDDKELVSQFYERIKVLQDQNSEPLKKLLADTLMMHHIAEGIRREEYYGLNHIKPTTLNAYFLATGNEMKSSMSFSSGSLVRLAKPFDSLIQAMEPARIKNAKYVQLHMVTNAIESKVREVQMQQEKFRREFDELSKKVVHENIISKFQNSYYYKRPDSIGLSNDENTMLKLIYDYHYTYNKKYNTKTRTETNPYPAKIERSSIYWGKQEAQIMHGRKWGKIIHDILAPKEYDNIMLDIVEKNEFGHIKEDTSKAKMSLKDIKKQFALEFGSGIPMPERRNFIKNKSLLKYYDNKAKEEFDRKRKDNSVEARIKHSSIAAQGAGKAVIETQQRNLAEEKTIESLIFSHTLKYVIGPIDYMMYHFGEDTDVSKWLLKYTNFILHKERPSSELGILDSRGANKMVSTIMMMNSLNKIAWNANVQVNNFAIGIGMNLTREPFAFTKGIGRIHKSLKIYRMLSNYKFVTIKDEALLDAVQKTMTVGILNKKERISISNWLVENGYKPMEWVETAIQASLVAGLLTQEELDNHGPDGFPLPGKDPIAEYRVMAIHDRVRRIHGDYTPLFAAPLWLQNEGALMMQFRKWIPGMIEGEFAGYHLNRNFELTAGVAGTLNLMNKMLVYNFPKDGQARKAKYDILLAEQEKRKAEPLSEQFLSSTKEYFDYLALQNAGGKIKWKESVTELDKRNLLSAALQLALYTLIVGARTLIEAALDDDWEKTDSPGLKVMARWLNRYQGDIFAPFTYDTQKSVLDMPLPGIDMVLNAMQFTYQSIIYTGGLIFDSQYEWMDKEKRERVKEEKGKKVVFPIDVVRASTIGTYKQDDRYALKGTPKFLVAFMKLIPAGNMLRVANMWRLKLLQNADVVNVETFLDSNKREARELQEYIMDDKGSNFLNKNNIERLSEQFKMFMEMSENLAFRDGLLELAKKEGIVKDDLSEIDLIRFLAVFESEKQINKDLTDIENALAMYQIKRIYKSDPESLDKGERAILDLINAVEDMEKSKAKEIVRHMPASQLQRQAKRGLYNLRIENELLEKGSVYDNRIDDLIERIPDLFRPNREVEQENKK